MHRREAGDYSCKPQHAGLNRRIIAFTQYTQADELACKILMLDAAMLSVKALGGQELIEYRAAAGATSRPALENMQLELLR